MITSVQAQSTARVPDVSLAYQPVIQGVEISQSHPLGRLQDLSPFGGISVNVWSFSNGKTKDKGNAPVYPIQAIRQSQITSGRV